jgi:hypothetical protein
VKANWTLGRATIAIAFLVLSLSTPASATSPSSTPGTADQIAAAVAASPSIKDLSASLKSQLPTASTDDPSRIYGNKLLLTCQKITSCTYGATKSTKTIILFGGSHAMMWLPAVVPWAKANGYKVVLLWEKDCPVADFTASEWKFPDTKTSLTSNTNCVTWREKSIAAIKALDPSLVLLGERTSNVLLEPGNHVFTNDQWATALEPTMTALKSSSTKVAIFEDDPYHDYAGPQCLTAHEKSVQTCSVTYLDPPYPGQQSAEATAAAATGTVFISTHQWLCTTNEATCASVIGNFITYWNKDHISAAYTSYLSTVVGDELSSILS